MAVVAVPRALREKLAMMPATPSSICCSSLKLSRPTISSRWSKSGLFVVWSRSENRLRNELREEMHAGFMGLQKQIGDVRAEIGSVRTELNKEIGSVRTELGKEIGSVRIELGKEIAEVRKEITVQTRWILAVLVAAAVLVPIIQRVMEALLP